MLCLGMLGDVVQQLLEGAKDGGGKPLGNVGVGNRDGLAQREARVTLGEFTAEPRHRRGRPQVIEHRWPQIHGDAADLLNRPLQGEDRALQDRLQVEGPRLVYELCGAFQAVLDGAQLLPDGVVKLAGDPLALVLLGIDELAGQRRELVARAAQRLLGRLAVHDLVLQVAIGVRERLRAQPHPRLELEVDGAQRFAHQVQRRHVRDHCDRERHGSVAAARRHAPQVDVQRPLEGRIPQLEFGRTALLQAPPRGGQRLAQLAAIGLAVAMQHTVQIAAEDFRDGAEIPALAHAVDAHHLPRIAEQRDEIRECIGSALPLELRARDGNTYPRSVQRANRLVALPRALAAHVGSDLYKLLTPPRPEHG